MMQLKFEYGVGLVRQLSRFSVVGIGATLVHMAVFVVTIELLDLSAMNANLAAFLVAFVVSFVGHWNWTFWHGVQRQSVIVPMLRFAGVALVGFGLNAAIVFSVTRTFALPYFWALIPMATLVPLCTFLLSRRWAFRPPRRS